jgi:hypothetical protein
MTMFGLILSILFGSSLRSYGGDESTYGEESTHDSLTIKD